jgi:hypothetical protein
MKVVKVLFFTALCSWFLSCSNSNTVYYDLPAMLNMSKDEIVYRWGEPKYSRKMKEFGSNTPTGFITIPTETTMDTYSVHGYALRIYYIPAKCEKPISFFLFKDDDDVILDSTAMVKLKRVYNLKDTTHLPRSVFQEASKSGFSILNIECR